MEEKNKKNSSLYFLQNDSPARVFIILASGWAIGGLEAVVGEGRARRDGPWFFLFPHPASSLKTGLNETAFLFLSSKENAHFAKPPNQITLPLYQIILFCQEIYCCINNTNSHYKKIAQKITPVDITRVTKILPLKGWTNCQSQESVPGGFVGWQG